MVSLQRPMRINSHSGITNTDGLCISGVRENHGQTLQVRRHPVNVMNSQIVYFPGLSQETPKHPDYALKSVRLSTFGGRRPGVMDPVELADAGFYYEGYSDRVRCFFCGGGMKDWRMGDNAWIEHARCFPNCAYVKVRKGENFVTMGTIDYVANETNFQSQTAPGVFYSGSGHQIDDQLIEDLNSTAAKLVMSMGYNQEDVEMAIRNARGKYGTVELRAQNILEVLLDTVGTGTLASVGANTTVPYRQSVTQSATGSLMEGRHSAASNQEPDVTIVGHQEVSEEYRHLLEENQTLKQQMICKICMDKDACIVFVPCGHMVSCADCARVLRTCAVCRSNIQGTIRAYPA